MIGSKASVSSGVTVQYVGESVEGDTDDRSNLAVVSEARGDVRVVVLHTDEVDVRQFQAGAAKFLRQGQQKIVCCPKLFEVFGEETVFPVVGGCAGGKAFKDFFRQHGLYKGQRGGVFHDIAPRRL